MNLAADRRTVRLCPGVEEAREADLRGVPGRSLSVDPDGVLSLDLGPCEIRTVQLRRHEASLARADLLDAAGPRQNA